MTTTVQTQKPTLRQGNSGNTVVELQQLLRNYADYIGSSAIYPGAIDGSFGTRTLNAVLAFQKQVFLPTTGVVADLTWRSLYLRAPVDLPDLAIGSHGDVVRLLQQRLVTLKYNLGAIDGEFGEKTRAAVRAFQAAANLPTHGIVDQKTWFELSKRPIA